MDAHAFAIVASFLKCKSSKDSLEIHRAEIQSRFVRWRFSRDSEGRDSVEIRSVEIHMCGRFKHKFENQSNLEHSRTEIFLEFSVGICPALNGLFYGEKNPRRTFQTHL